jgi:hypothetical protein
MRLSGPIFSQPSGHEHVAELPGIVQVNALRKQPAAVGKRRPIRVLPDSDVWKAYMRRATNTVNFGMQLPLAQGVRFDIEE